MMKNQIKKQNSGRGTFGTTSTGRVAADQKNRISRNSTSATPGRTASMGPNLHTANRSRMSVNSVNSRLMSDVNSNGLVSAQTEALFNKTIDYSAQRGNDCDERLAELIKELNIRMPIKMIEDGKYMFGTRIVKANLEMRTVMVRVGGGYREFKEYVKCEDLELRRLQLKIEQTGLTLDQLVRKMLNAARRKKFGP